MNAPHPIPALHGHLAAAAPSLDALEPVQAIADMDRHYAMGELTAGLSALAQVTYAIEAATLSVERAIARGIGSADQRDALDRICGRLGDVTLKVETTTSRLTSRLAGAR